MNQEEKTAFDTWFEREWLAYPDKEFTNRIVAKAWALKAWRHLISDGLRFTQDDMERYGKCYADARDSRRIGGGRLGDGEVA